MEVQLARAETSRREVEGLGNGVLITLIGLLISFLLALQASRDVTRPILRLTEGVRALRRGVDVEQQQVVRPLTAAR